MAPGRDRVSHCHKIKSEQTEVTGIDWLSLWARYWGGVNRVFKFVHTKNHEIQSFISSKDFYSSQFVCVRAAYPHLGELKFRLRIHAGLWHKNYYYTENNLILVCFSHRYSNNTNQWLEHFTPKDWFHSISFSSINHRVRAWCWLSAASGATLFCEEVNVASRWNYISDETAGCLLETLDGHVLLHLLNFKSFTGRLFLPCVLTFDLSFLPRGSLSL